jgi:hypothetical protein
MAKMLRSTKVFGRCRVQGHGSRCWCEPIDEIQNTPITRAQDKRDWKREIEVDINAGVAQR